MTSASGHHECTATETLHRGSGTTLYRALAAFSEDDHRSVILKVLDPRRCRQQDLERLRHEYETGTSLDTRAIVRPLALETYQGMPALLLEDFGGQPLDRLLGASTPGTPMPVERFLDLAVRIAGAVSELHRQGVVHKDLKPGNILVHPATLEVKLGDLGLATRLPRERQTNEPPQVIEGSLPYLSPEQTGRMNRVIDSRTDLYSLGVIFYQMLTGRLPFEARDPVEWVHCHVAREPTSPARLVPELPDTLARLVMKLLSKMADDRYQTAGGLRHDLARCLEQWRTQGSVDPFPLGERDAPDRFQIPQKLYGREEQVAALLGAFERVVATGTPELVLVSGYSGIGKSSVVHELQKPLVRERGIFLGGKFEELARGIPYSTLVRAFADLVLGLMVEEEPRVTGWRQEIQRALGIHGKLIADVIAPLKLLIGEQPAVPELPVTEAEQRFRSVFRAFLAVFATEGHPLVLFLDDMQWADAGSLRLVEDVITNPDTRHLLLIGAYRDNEVDPSHPLALTLERIRKRPVVVNEVVIPPLGLEHLVELVAEAVRADRERARPLAVLVRAKTGGNPFFAIQFLTTLYREQLLQLDEATLSWRWDTAKIGEKGYTDNVVDFMARGLTRLPASTQDVLGIAASIGNRGKISLLALAHGKPEDETLADLRDGIQEGLILRTRDSYAFAHDRVQQAAYSLIPEDRRIAIHLRVGQLVFEHATQHTAEHTAEQTAPDEIEERIFDIVTQLNLGAALLTGREQRTWVAELNLRAARKAKAAAAYRAAVGYLSTGAALLGGDPWEQQPDLAFALHLELAECQLLCGAFDEAERLFPLLRQRARTRLDRSAVYRVEIDTHCIKGEGGGAIENALECLEMFGIEMPPHPSAEEVQAEYEEVWRNLGTRDIEQLIDLPLATDPEVHAAMEILARLYIPAYYSDANLFHLHLCHAVNQSLRHGNSPASTYAYGWFGVILVSAFHRPREGYRFARLAYDLMERHRFLAYKAKACFQMMIVARWTRPLDEMIDHVRAAFEAALETGDIAVACFSRSEALLGMLSRGDHLSEVAREAELGLDFARRAGFSDVCQLIAGTAQFVRAMQGRTRHLSTYDDEGFSEAEFEAALDRNRMPSLVFYYHSVKLMARFLSGDHEAALASGEESKALLWAGLFSAQSQFFCLYHALAVAAVFQELPPEEQKEALGILAAHREQLREWAEVYPPTYHGSYALLSAETARVGGQGEEAMRLYEEAIRSARQNGFVQNEALAHELASRFYRTRGFDLVADAYLREARACYARWGADGKVKQLDQLHPQLMGQRLGQRLGQQPIAPMVSFAARTEQLDLLSVVKASQTISGEIEIEKLVGTLLQVVLEQGGARKGYLILAHEGSLSIEAEATLEEQGVVTRVLPSLPVESSTLLPVTVAHYARLTREPVILDDATADTGKWATDAYFTRHRPRSVLCLPIVRQESLVGLLYLENSLAAGAFTSDRLTALTLLAAQAAISMENALLHGEAQRAVRVRDEFLVVASHELRTPMTPITLSLRTLQDAQRSGQIALPAPLSQLVELAARQGVRLNRLIADLLAVSCIETGLLPLDLSEVELGAIVRDVAEGFASDLSGARCALSVRRDAPVVGRWDSSRLEHLVKSLLSNAIKFGAGKPIEILVAREGATARLSVRDHGIGIDPARQALVFGRLERGVSVQHYGGLGLGLYIGRRIVEAHRGSIRVESGAGVGSTFTVELPCAGPNEASARE
jgi:predicted ATPase/signal transduction histidine kinase/tRNA A-37 threonylcarbamoyl transferase component Bud32